MTREEPEVTMTLNIHVRRVDSDGVHLEIVAEDMTGPLFAQESVVKPGMTWPIKYRAWQESA